MIVLLELSLCYLLGFCAVVFVTRHSFPCRRSNDLLLESETRGVELSVFPVNFHPAGGLALGDGKGF